jgi:flagellar protein FlaJ
MGVAPVGYASVILYYTFLSVLAFAGTAVLLCFLFFSPLPLLLLFGPLIVFLILLYYPVAGSRTRAEAIENELPALATYAAMAGSAGISAYKVLETLASKPSPLSASKGEGADIIKTSVWFTKDPLLAMEQMSTKHPSSQYRAWLSGLIYVTRTGGALAKHLEEAADRAIEQLEQRWASFAERAVDMGNMVMMAYSFVPLLVFVMVTIFASNMPNFTLLLLYIFIVSPLTTAGMLLMIERVLPRTPEETGVFYIRTLPWLAIAAVVGVGLFLAGFKSYVTLAVALIVFSAPACVAFEVSNREELSVERYLPEFLADVTESKRIGQELERAIPRISEISRYSQPLNRIVKILAVNIETGAPIPRAVELAMARLRGWFSKVVFFLLQEAFLTGGGTVIMFERITKFTRNYIETRNRIRHNLRTHVAMYYVTALIVVAAVVLVLRFALLPQSMLFGQVAGGLIPMVVPSPEQVEYIVSLIMAGVVINSFELGLLAGKVSEGSLISGLKHCAAAVAITLGAFLVAGIA